MMINSAIKIFVSGDFCPIHRMENLLETSDINQVFGELAEQIESADLAITNLECPLTLSNKPIKKTGPALKGLPKTSLFLKSAGFIYPIT